MKETLIFFGLLVSVYLLKKGIDAGIKASKKTTKTKLDDYFWQAMKVVMDGVTEAINFIFGKKK